MSATATPTCELIRPGDDEYDSARRVFNGAIDRRPALIARCHDAADVAWAVRHARAAGLPLAVRAGGHSMAGRSVPEDGLVVDVRALQSIEIDAAARTARVGAGLLLGQLDHATQAHGLAVPAGTVSHTGLAGLTLGGGIGWLSPRLGLTIDSLRAVGLVTAEGDVVRASEDEHPDLFWAVRGAGASVGAVTSFEFDLHPVGPMVVAGPRLYPFARAAEVLATVGSLELHEELGLGCAFITVPPAPHFPVGLHGTKALAVVPVWSGDHAEARAALAPLDVLGEPLLDAVGPMPYAALQSMLDDTAPHGLHYRTTAAHLGALDGTAAETIASRFAEVPGPRTHVIVTRLGGAVARVPADATAFAHRDATWLAWTIGVWEPEDDPVAHESWIAGMREAVGPLAAPGVYVNALDGDPNGAEAAYGPALARLREVKRRWDPDGVFPGAADV